MQREGLVSVAVEIHEGADPCVNSRITENLKPRKTEPCLQDTFQGSLSAELAEFRDATSRDVVVQEAASEAIERYKMGCESSVLQGSHVMFSR